MDYSYFIEINKENENLKELACTGNIEYSDLGYFEYFSKHEHIKLHQYSSPILPIHEENFKESNELLHKQNLEELMHKQNLEELIHKEKLIKNKNFSLRLFKNYSIVNGIKFPPIKSLYEYKNEVYFFTEYCLYKFLDSIIEYKFDVSLIKYYKINIYLYINNSIISYNLEKNIFYSHNII